LGLLKSECYSYSAYLLDGKFEMIVSVTKDGQQVISEIFDLSTKERYVLHRISNATGSFVSRVRKEYESVLDSIDTNCCEPHIFKSKNAEQVICYVREKYHDELQFLWKKFPQNAVFRRQDNSKWYAVLLVVSKKKLGLQTDDMVDIIDLRVNSKEIDSLVDGKKYYPGYHMNKKHWVTICLDGSVPIDEVFCRIDESYVLVSEKKLTKGTKDISFSKTQIGKVCFVIELLACRLGRNDEAPNVELAQKLCDNKDMKGVQELVEGLKSGEQAVANDCIKVLYEIGQRKPELIADFADDFITALSGKNNRVAWGSMTALTYIASLSITVVNVF
jgi:predicted DNA-binding protein (MmcQ/YjbR family)